MKNCAPVSLILLSITVPPWSLGQGEYTIPLPGANLSRSIPLLRVAEDGVLYAAYRSPGWLGKSNTLQVFSYDLKSRAQLRRNSLRLPSVSGPRAAGGFYLSQDASTLFYAELYPPYVVLAISTKDLVELKRTEFIPFAERDRRRKFVGPKGNSLLAFAADAGIAAPGQRSGVRLLFLDSGNLSVVSNRIVPELIEHGIEDLLWSPASGEIWIQEDATRWREYSELGQATGNELDSKRYLSHGAALISDDSILAFYGNWDQGLILRYRDRKVTELALDCSPYPDGASGGTRYAGVDCVRRPDKKWEDGGDRILSSEFLLLQTMTPAVVWRGKIAYMDITEGRQMGYQRSTPAIFDMGSKLWVIAPSKPALLVVHEIEQKN